MMRSVTSNFSIMLGTKPESKNKDISQLKKKLYKHSINACDEMGKVGRQPEGQFLVWGEHCMDLWVNDWNQWQYDGEVSWEKFRRSRSSAQLQRGRERSRKAQLLFSQCG